MAQSKGDFDGRTCDYCGKRREIVRFYIGASLPDSRDPETGEYGWVLWEGTGKLSCDDRDCWTKGQAESKQVHARV